MTVSEIRGILREAMWKDVPRGNVAECWHRRGISVASIMCRRFADVVAKTANAMNSEYDDPGPLHAQVDVLRQAAEVLSRASCLPGLSSKAELPKRSRLSSAKAQQVLR